MRRGSAASAVFFLRISADFLSASAWLRPPASKGCLGDRGKLQLHEELKGKIGEVGKRMGGTSRP